MRVTCGNKVAPTCCWKVSSRVARVMELFSSMWKLAVGYYVIETIAACLETYKQSSI